MSNKEQTPASTNTDNVRRSLLIIIAAVVVGTVWYAMAAKNKTDEVLKDTKTVNNAQSDTTKASTYADWKSYSWDSEDVSFQHPDGWFVGQNGSAYRLYVKNIDADLMKEATPEGFQQVWISVDVDESSAAREAAIKKGESAYRVVNGEVKASTIKAGSLTINTYEYDTAGGPTLEAYWTGKDGKRYYATNSTEVGQQNQADMVAMLKKLLATVAIK